VEIIGTVRVVSEAEWEREAATGRQGNVDSNAERPVGRIHGLSKSMDVVMPCIRNRGRGHVGLGRDLRRADSREDETHVPEGPEALQVKTKQVATE
jgi:hypothetical protein